jgi:hypothetical protein
MFEMQVSMEILVNERHKTTAANNISYLKTTINFMV